MNKPKDAPALSVVDDLPDELKKQLSIRYLSGGKPRGEITTKVLDIIDKEMSIDEILIAYWKKTKEVLTRGSMSARLSNLVKKDMLSAGSKGRYKPYEEEKD